MPGLAEAHFGLPALLTFDKLTGYSAAIYPWGLIVEESIPKPASRREVVAPKLPPDAHAVTLFLVLAICCRIYLHLAANEQLGLFTSSAYSYHSQLAEAFRHGQLSLLNKPKPELLALPDPYVPELNRPYRMHDASLYRGKYYLYFGPTPALVLNLPVRWLTGYYPSDATELFLFLTAGLAAWLTIFYLAIRAWFPGISLVWTLLGGLALGMCSTGPFVLARPAVYEVCLACAYCFTAVCFLCLTKALTAGPSWRNLLAAGVALSLAIGSRPPALLIAPIVMAALLWRFSREGTRWRDQLRRLLPFAIPLAVTGGLLAAYNYLRFDNPLQFGNTYQLAAIYTPNLQFFRPSRIPSGLHHYLFSSQRTTPEFPFVRLAPAKPEELVEEVAGVLPLYPFLAALLVLPALLWRSDSARPDLRLLATVLAAAGSAHLLLLCCFAGTTMRYELEFGPLLAMAAVLAICLAAASLSRWRWAGLVFAPALLAGALQGCLLGFTGYYGNYEPSHRGSTAAIQASLLPVENGLARWLGGYGGIELRLEARAGAPNHVQVLVSTGVEETENRIVMRSLDSGTVQFGCAVHGREASYGRPVQLAPGSIHTIEAYTGAMYPDSRVIYASWFDPKTFAPETYDSAHSRCAVRVDGATVNDIRPSEAAPGAGKLVFDKAGNLQVSSNGGRSAPWRVVADTHGGPSRILSSRRILAPPPGL